MSLKYACPSCGAEVVFRSSASILAVCVFCQSTLIRHDLDLQNFGKMTDLPADLSPLQIGSRGTFEQKRFEVVGRQRIGWSDGAWNEWFLHFDSGKDAWLADAQGDCMISFEMPAPTEVSESQCTIGQKFTIASLNYTVTDRREVTCIGSQGELPFRAVPGRKSISVDLTGSSGVFANFDFSSEGNRLFTGKYKSFEELSLENLRTLDGW